MRLLKIELQVEDDESTNEEDLETLKQIYEKEVLPAGGYNIIFKVVSIKEEV